MKMPKQRTSKIPAISLLIAVIGFGGYVWFHQVHPQPESTPKASQDNQFVLHEEESADDKQKFPEISELPTRIFIDKIGVDTTIEPVGLTEDGLMDAPNNNETVGWYDKSARAGEDKYAMLLDGHYGTNDNQAVFWRLMELQVGDEIRIQGSEGSVLKYQVVETEQQYTEDVDMSKAMHPYEDGGQSLTIITCDGLFDPANLTYDKRTIVYAKRVA